MKITTKNAVYIQKNYYQILLRSTYVTKTSIPVSIYDITDKRVYSLYDAKDFVKITKKEGVEFLKNASWIPDYNDYANKSIEDVKKEIALIDQEGEQINQWFAKLSKCEQRNQYNYFYIKAKMLMFKKCSLEDIIELKENNMTPEYKTNIVKKLKRII